MDNLNSLTNNMSNNLSNKKGSKFTLKNFLSRKNLGNKIGTIFLIVVIILIIYFSHQILKSYRSNKLPGIQEVVLHKYLFDCKNQQEIIDNNFLPKPVIGNEYHLTFWIYINDIKHDFYEDKNVLVKGDITESIGNETKPVVKNPHIYIPKETNSLNFEFELEQLSSDEKQGCYALTPEITPNDFSKKTPESCHQESLLEEKSYYAMTNPDSEKKEAECLSLNGSDFQDLDKTDDNSCLSPGISSYNLGSKDHAYITYSGSDIEGSCQIKNMPLQRWNCVAINVHNNICDIFLDGKLIETCVFNSGIKLNNFPLILGGIQTGGPSGFDGYLSNVKYTNKTLNSTEIYRNFNNQGPAILLNFKDTIKNGLQSK